MSEAGFIETTAGALFFEERGGRELAPLVCVHGGPGFGSHYLEPFYDLSDQWRVICYDQAGSGRSRERCSSRKLFTIEAFVEELESLRKERGLEKMSLLGHSFGGLIIGEYALRYPTRVQALIFLSASIDMPRWIEDGLRLVSKLPLMQRMILREGLRTGEFRSQQFQQALGVYYAKHVYGLSEKPEYLMRSEEQSDPETYRIVWGESELAVTGMQRDYSLSPRLHELSAPTLFACGRNDEATPEAHQYFTSLVSGSKCHIFEHSAHHPHISERESCISVVRSFLNSVTQALHR